MSGWEEKLDPVSGRPYYVNRQTRESRWEPPAGFGAVDAGADGSIDGDAEADDGDDFFTSLNVEERLAVQGQQRNERIDAMQESAVHEVEMHRFLSDEELFLCEPPEFLENFFEIYLCNCFHCLRACYVA